VLSASAIAIYALFTKRQRLPVVGGWSAVISGPIAYLIFKRVYRGTADSALEGSMVTPEGELTTFGAEVEAQA